MALLKEEKSRIIIDKDSYTNVISKNTADWLRLKIILSWRYFSMINKQIYSALEKVKDVCLCIIKKKVIIDAYVYNAEYDFLVKHLLLWEFFITTD
jgi:hypothetical protein